MIKIALDNIDLIVQKEWIGEERNWRDKVWLENDHSREYIRQ